LPPVTEQIARLVRGAVDVVSRDELQARLQESLARKRPLRVKLGIDPSSPDIHLGHTVVLRKLRDFQRLGHLPIVLWGTATAMVGDPSGRNKTRPQLSRKEVEANKATYRSQVGKVLDMSRVEERENGEWFDPMRFMDCVKLAARWTVAQVLERDSFAERWQQREPIAIHELLYPLMQGWDSVELKADVELGGTDQLFNLLVGRELQKQEGQRPQVCLTVPILEGLDGAQKMSKSLGNYVGVAEPAREMFGKLMSIPDALLRKYFTLLTDRSDGEIETLLAGHPRAAKAELARAIAAGYHGEEAAGAAAAEFDRVFRQGGLPDQIPEVRLGESLLRGGAVQVAAALAAAGICPSNSEGRRLIAGGGVKVDGQPVGGEEATLRSGRYLLQSGKRKVVWVVVP
jgi:tyrosyl-tRNA synthetase